MPTELIKGEEALAIGAIEAGVSVVAGYPGSPASAVVQAIIDRTRPEDVYAEWSTNEKVAMEVGIGASIAGARTLVAAKSVGFNVLVDPLMAVNLTGVNAGLVLLMGDDPGAYGSQNDQDTRPLAAFAEVPLLEPSTPSEAKKMMIEAFDLSEGYNTVVIVRLTRSFGLMTEEVAYDDSPKPRPRRDMVREPYRFVPNPSNAVEKHGELHEKLGRITDWANTSAFNETSGEGKKGVIGVGFSHTKMMDVLGSPSDGLRIFKLATAFPLPERLISHFLQECDEVLVVEETEPFVEDGVKSIAADLGLSTRIRGSGTDDLPREGELFRWQIQEGLERFIDGFSPDRSYSSADESDERPYKKDYCAGCPYPEIIAAIKEVGQELGEDLVFTGDPGCLVKASAMLDAKYAMGSAVAVAHGMVRAGISERTVACFGDSAFFHTAVPALINAVWLRTPVLMAVMDNSFTVTSGNQPNPGTGVDARGAEAPKLSIEKIAEGCGVEFIRTVGPDDDMDVLRSVFREGLNRDGLGLIVVRKPCAPV